MKAHSDNYLPEKNNLSIKRDKFSIEIRKKGYHKNFQESRRNINSSP